MTRHEVQRAQAIANIAPRPKRPAYDQAGYAPHCSQPAVGLSQAGEHPGGIGMRLPKV